MSRARPAAWRVLIYDFRHLGLMSIAVEDLAEIAGACPWQPQGNVQDAE